MRRTNSSVNFEIQTDQVILARQPDLLITNKKEKTFRIIDLTVFAEHRVKLKESKKSDKYFDFAGN